MRNTFAMLTAYDKAAEDYGRIGEANKLAYCAKHGIPFICETEHFSPCGPCWSKLLLVAKNLPHYDWLFWTDADSLVMNSEIRLTPPNTQKDLVLAYDRSTLNTGQFWIRNVPWSYDFLIRAYCLREGAWFIEDNGAVMSLFEDNIDDMWHFEVVSQRLWNSYEHNGSYKPGDFMLHFAGLCDKKELMEKWSKLAV